MNKIIQTPGWRITINNEVCGHIQNVSISEGSILIHRKVGREIKSLLAFIQSCREAASLESDETYRGTVNLEVNFLNNDGTFDNYRLPEAYLSEYNRSMGSDDLYSIEAIGFRNRDCKNIFYENVRI